MLGRKRKSRCDHDVELRLWLGQLLLDGALVGAVGYIVWWTHLADGALIAAFHPSRQPSRSAHFI